MCRSARQANALDRRLAAAAGLAGLVVDPEFVLITSGLIIAVIEIRDR